VPELLRRVDFAYMKVSSPNRARLLGATVATIDTTRGTLKVTVLVRAGHRYLARLR